MPSDDLMAELKEIEKLIGKLEELDGAIQSAQDEHSHVSDKLQDFRKSVAARLSSIDPGLRQHMSDHTG